MDADPNRCGELLFCLCRVAAVTAIEAREIADEHIRWWRSAPIYLSPVGMWLALAHEYRPYVTEDDVREFLVGWSMGQQDQRKAA